MFEFFIALYVIYILFTQIILPIIEHRRIWPAFRKRSALEQDLDELREDLETAALQKQVDKLSNKFNNKEKENAIEQ